MALADQEIVSGMMEVWEPSLQRDPRQGMDLEHICVPDSHNSSTNNEQVLS